MTLSSVTILKSISPISFLDKPNPKTLEYLGKLLNEPEFNKFVDTIRSESKFPKDGISLKQFEGKNLFELPILNNDLLRSSLEYSVSTLSKSLGISDEFNTNLLLLVYFNAFIDVEYFDGFITDPIRFFIGRKNISTSMWNYTHEVGAIVIPFNMSQRTLLNWIKNKENWQIIQKQMDDNLTTDPYLLRVHKNTELALKIVDLKDQQEKTFNQISSLLSKKYPDDERLKGEEGVKKIYYDYKQIWNSRNKQSK